MRKSAYGLFVAAAVAVTMLFTASPAQAAVYRYEMTNFQEICRYGCAGNGNTLLKQIWQNILWETYHPNGWSVSACQSWIAGGGFGPNTDYWTRQWQKNHVVWWGDTPVGLSVDGRVGPNTWMSAEQSSWYSHHGYMSGAVQWHHDYFTWGNFTLLHQYAIQGYWLKSRWIFNLCYGSQQVIYQEDNGSPWNN